MKDNKHKRFTAEDIEYIKKNYGNIDIRLMANKLGRTTISVNKKAQSLGLNSSNSELIKIIDVANMFGVKNSTVLEYWVKKYGLKVKRINISKVGQRCSVMVKLDDLLKWMKNNPERYMTHNLELYALGIEPKWLKEKRELDLKVKPKRWWDKKDEHRLLMYYRMGLNYKQMSEKLDRTPNACKLKLFKLFEVS